MRKFKVFYSVRKRKFAETLQLVKIKFVAAVCGNRYADQLRRAPLPADFRIERRREKRR